MIGFLGGRDRWDDGSKGVRRLALGLRDPERGLFAETFENRRVGVALDFVVETLDADRNGSIDGAEAGRVRVVVYGQSLGGGATLVLARLLDRRSVPVWLTVQIDSVGIDDGTVPPNVRHAANLYQGDGWLIAGEHPIRAVDPGSTRVLGNWAFRYDVPPGSAISIDDLPWHKRLFREEHARMDRDPRVWSTVERLVRAGCGGGVADRSAAAWIGWRERVGIEPTPDAIDAPDDGFEDRRGHQTPSAPARVGVGR